MNAIAIAGAHWQCVTRDAWSANRFTISFFDGLSSSGLPPYRNFTDDSYGRLMSQILIAAFYKFAALPDYVERRDQIRQTCLDAGLSGTILLAEEGINGTIAGAPDRVHDVLAFLRSSPEFADMIHKEAMRARNAVPAHESQAET